MPTLLVTVGHAVLLLGAQRTAARPRRMPLATLFALQGWTPASQALQIIGDLEVTIFMVALFVSLLLAHLQVRHDEPSRSLTELKTLSGLLPICAWCRKVRDDDGYWQQKEVSFESQSRVKFTHGICADCAREKFGPTVTRVE